MADLEQSLFEGLPPRELGSDIFEQDPSGEAARALDAKEDAAGKPKKPKKKNRRARLISSEDVRRENVVFEWWPYIPRGKFTILEGDPGDGKTMIAIDIAARISRGKGFPGQEAEELTEGKGPGDVIFLTAEDGLGDTLKPRLSSAGADHTRVHFLECGVDRDEDGEEKELSFTLADMDVLEDALKQKPETRLLVFDPLHAFLPSGTDSHKATDVRAALSPIINLADERKFIVLGIRHLTKSAKSRAILGGQGSIDFSAAARSILSVGKYQGGHYMAHVKSNLARFGDSQQYGIISEESSGGRIEWLGPSDVTAEEVRATLEPREAPSRGRAEDFLERTLEDGPKSQQEIREAAVQERIPFRTLERAKKTLGVKSEVSYEENRIKGWQWRL